MTYPTLPPEFFSVTELCALAGSPQRKRVIAWIEQKNITHVIGLHGWPLVYRERLLPQAAPEAHNDAPTFDFGAIHATRRQTAQRRAS